MPRVMPLASQSRSPESIAMNNNQNVGKNAFLESIHSKSFGSKTIVLDAKKSNSIVAIEDLTGIRERTNQQPRNKTERRRSNLSLIK